MIQLKRFQLIFTLLFSVISSSIIYCQVDPVDFVTEGDVYALGGGVFFNNNGQSIQVESTGAIRYTSQHNRVGRIQINNNLDRRLGSIYGTATSFGLLNRANQWVVEEVTSGGVTHLRTNNVITMSLYNTGKVRIGSVNITPAGYKLFVEDGILTEKLRVAVDGAMDWADYVFEEDFELMPLQNVKEFINKNGHLPNVPSAEQMVETGLDVLESDAILLRKIEEAYLYILDQNDRILDQNEQIQELRAEIVNLKK